MKPADQLARETVKRAKSRELSVVDVIASCEIVLTDCCRQADISWDECLGLMREMHRERHGK